MPSEEMFYTDKDGNRQDSDLHAELLANKKADKATRTASAKIAFSRGAAMDEITDLFGANPLD
jgi:hypothetical protein